MDGEVGSSHVTDGGQAIKNRDALRRSRILKWWDEATKLMLIYKENSTYWLFTIQSTIQ